MCAGVHVLHVCVCVGVGMWLEMHTYIIMQTCMLVWVGPVRPPYNSVFIIIVSL